MKTVFTTQKRAYIVSVYSCQKSTSYKRLSKYFLYFLKVIIVLYAFLQATIVINSAIKSRLELSMRAGILKASLSFDIYSELMTAQAERQRIRSPEKINALDFPYRLFSKKLKLSWSEFSRGMNVRMQYIICNSNVYRGSVSLTW